jgi:hypothetical protein
MESLPIELFTKIFTPIISEKNFNVKKFLELQYISKSFYELINSYALLIDVCKIKSIYNTNLKSFNIKDLKNFILLRLYDHKYNFGYNRLPYYMRLNQFDMEDFNINNILTTNFNGEFDKIIIKDSENNIVLDLSNDKTRLNNFKVVIKKHELFMDIYAIYFKLNNNDNYLAYSNLNDYKVNILGVVY